MEGVEAAYGITAVRMVGVHFAGTHTQAEGQLVQPIGLGHVTGVANRTFAFIQGSSSGRT